MSKREELEERSRSIGECYAISTGVYCPRVALPGSAAGLCSRCSEREWLRKQIAAQTEGER